MNNSLTVPTAPTAAESRGLSEHSPGAGSAEVYAVIGADPEVNAYALAKYSRSALSLRESLAEIDGHKAEKFLNTFYFQYGHKSIADLAHISFAIERLSILAAIEVADETRWDGQERSTRYQEFRRSGWYTPAFDSRDDESRYRRAIEALFEEYEWFSAAALAHLKQYVPRPAEMKPESYERTLRARAFDVSRYLLPLATATSLGQIVSARTLEQQIVRLLSSRYEEVRNIGTALRNAASEPAWDLRQPRAARIRKALDEAATRLDQADALLADAEVLARPVRACPTLVKYTDPSAYMIETRGALHELAAELLAGVPSTQAPAVDLLDAEPLEIELATTLLYPVCHHSYRQIRQAVEAAGATRRQEIIDLGFAHRGRHDELLREFQAGQPFRFDILMDIGGFRDMHRHRRCVQIHQDYTFAHGFDVPQIAGEMGAGQRFANVLRQAENAAAELPAGTAPYLMPLACRKRSMFKMDLAEVAYIAELRTTPAGHFSYRSVAWQMFEALRARHPEIARHLRVVDPQVPVDLLQR